MRRLLQVSLTVSMLVLLVGCTVGPEPDRGDSIAQHMENYINTPSEVAMSEASVGRWWQSLGDSVTSQLVEEALRNCPDINAAAAHVLEAQAMFKASTGGRLPVASVDATVMRGKSIGMMGPMTATTYNLNFNVAWQVDFFGRLKRQQQAAFLSAQAMEATRDAVAHTIVATTIKLRTQIAAMQCRLDVNRENIDTWQRQVNIVTRRYDRGVASQFEVRQAREYLSASRAIEPQLELGIAQLHNALDIVIGRQPGSGERLPRTLSRLPNLSSVPPGLPASLLDRRPDLRATELMVAAETANVGVAIADLYPDLTLSAGVGLQSGKVEKLFESDSFVWNILASAAQKIFSGGALRANVEAAKARAQGAAAEYAGAVLAAIGEVEDAMLRERYNHERYVALEHLLDEAVAVEKLAVERYGQGVEPLLFGIVAERARVNAQMELINIEQELWDARIDLYLAIGGDWKTDHNGVGAVIAE